MKKETNAIELVNSLEKEGFTDIDLVNQGVITAKIPEDRGIMDFPQVQNWYVDNLARHRQGDIVIRWVYVI